MVMSDRSTNQVLLRRLGAVFIDVGTVASITALAAWAKAEKFIPDQIKSDSDLPIWSTVDQARRDDIAQDSWNRMQKVGNTEYVWSRDSLLTVGLVGLGAAALVFLLIPAVIRSTIGKKIFRIRTRRKSADTGVDGGQLDRRAGGDDPEASLIDLDDRLSRTHTAPSPEDGANSVPKHPGQADEIFPSESDLNTNSVPLSIDLASDPVGSPDDLLPIDVLPIDVLPQDTSVDVPSSEALTNPTAGKITTLDHQPIDVEAGGLLGMEVSEDLPDPWPNQSSDLDDTISSNAAASDDPPLPNVAAVSDDATETGTALESAVETPIDELPDLGFGQPVNSTLSVAATIDGDDEESQPLPPPPLHRAVKWDPPTAEPAPVWSPEAEQSLNVDQLVDAETALVPEPELAEDPAEASQSIVSDMPTQASDEVGDGPAVSTTPSWNEDWQAWIYWDQTHGQWLRHDVEADVWIPLS